MLNLWMRVMRRQFREQDYKQQTNVIYNFFYLGDVFLKNTEIFNLIV